MNEVNEHDRPQPQHGRSIAQPTKQLRTGGQQLALALAVVRAPYGALVRVGALQRLPRSHVPHQQSTLVISRSQKLAISAGSQARDSSHVAKAATHTCAGAQVPHPYRAVG